MGQLNRTVACICVVALAIGACNKVDKKRQEPSDPTGRITGTVRDLRTGARLEGVKVTVLDPDPKKKDDSSGRIEVTTDAQGAYILDGLPAGATYRVRMELDGYVTRFADAEIPSAAGEYPQGNAVTELDVSLAAANAAVRGRVFAQEGAPVEGAVLTIDLRDQGYDLVKETTTDADGKYAIDALPGAPAGLNMSVVVQPYDDNGDELPDYSARSVGTTLFPDTTTRLDIDLRPAAEELLLLSSDLDDGEHPPAMPIQMRFNRALEAGSAEVTLTDADVGRTIATTVQLGESATNVTITPAGDTPMSLGHTMSLQITARGRNGYQGTFSRTFRVIRESEMTLPPVSGLEVMPTDADWTSRNFNLKWDRVDGARGYALFARDTYDNPSYLRITTVGDSPAPATTVTLPGAFDYFSGDAWTTPLLFGTMVEFAVVPIDSLGVVHDPAMASSVSRSDTIGPSVTGTTQRGDDANNSDGSDVAMVELDVSFSEYIDTGAAPSIELPSSSASATFELDDDWRGGTFTIEVPAGEDATGTYTISGAKDTSGNAMESFEGDLTGRIELVTNGTFEGGSPCDLSDWTPSTTGTASSPVATDAEAASGSCSARLGNGTGSAESGVSQIEQTITLPSGYSSIVASIAYRTFTNQGTSSDYSWCYIAETDGSYEQYLFYYDYSERASYRTSSRNLSAWAGQTIKLICQSYQSGSYISGMYVDDVSIVAQP